MTCVLISFAQKFLVIVIIHSQVMNQMTFTFCYNYVHMQIPMYRVTYCIGRILPLHGYTYESTVEIIVSSLINLALNSEKMCLIELRNSIV
jgi:hypothetical protein